VFVTRKTTPRGGTFVKNFALEKGRSLDLLRGRRYIGKNGASNRSPRKPLVAPKK
jgi:hypothetical protein